MKLSNASGLGDGATVDRAGQETGFALAVIAILLVLFVPLPPILIDLGLALSISLSIVILMVALWIRKPLEFSAFPTILLIATMLRLALNIATTRLILTHGNTGADSAGHVIAGFADFVMGGDFLIGTVVFIILVTVNFLVITKGATRIAEVGARFSLDAMPGKQMAIDADLSAGTVDEATANARRRELEEESAFFGAMDGASKFVRGDAIAGLIITGVNIFGGILIGVVRHGMSFDQAIDIYTRLSVGDGLVTQIPALIVSLAAGLLVSKGGTRGSAESAVVSQLGGFPQALMVSAAVVGALALTPGLPLLPFLLLSGGLVAAGGAVRRSRHEQAARQTLTEEARARDRAAQAKPAFEVASPDVEISFGRQLSLPLLRGNDQLDNRVARMRRSFARQYGIILPDIRLSDEPAAGTRFYEIRIFGSTVARGELRPGDVMIVLGQAEPPDLPGETATEPAFGMRAMWFPEAFTGELRRLGYVPVDNLSVLLTHLSEALRSNLASLMTYKGMRGLLDQLQPEYRKLVDELVPTSLSYSGLQTVLKTLLAERVSVRNLHLVLEAIAEVAAFTRKSDVIAEHVRTRIAQQLCGDLAQNGVLKVLRLGNRWELAFHHAIKRDAKGEVIEFDIEPKLIEQFGAEAMGVIQKHLDEGTQFCVTCAAGSRPYVRMVLERMFPSVSVLAHSELVRGVQLQSLGTIS